MKNMYYKNVLQKKKSHALSGNLKHDINSSDIHPYRKSIITEYRYF